MFRFGHWTDERLTIESLPHLSQEARGRAEHLFRIPAQELLKLLDRLQAWWSGVQTSAGHAHSTCEAAPYTGDLLSADRQALVCAMSRGRWERQLALALGDTAILDAPRRLPSGSLHAFPLGVVLHGVETGDEFDVVDSLLASLLTKNVPVLLIHKSSRPFAEVFLRSLSEVDVSGALARSVAVFAGVDPAVNRYACARGYIDAAVCAAEPAFAPAGLEHVVATPTRLIHRIVPLSIAVISLGYWTSCDRSRTLECLIKSFGLSQGTDRSSVLRLYTEEGVDFEAQLESLPDRTKALLRSRLSVLYFDSAQTLCTQIRATSGPSIECLCGFQPKERPVYLRALARSGVRRMIPIDSCSEAADAGRGLGFPLQDLVDIVSDEQSFGVEELLLEAAEQVPFYHDRKPFADRSKLSSWPLLTGVDLALKPVYESRYLLNRTVSEGSIFSSGGTSTAPKYALYSPAEFSRSAEMLAKGFLASGLRPGDRVINLFVAGHLWSSFLVVDDALRRCGVYVLPMGGLSPMAEIMSCLSSFKPQVMFGLPSMLVDYARHCEQTGLDFTVERVFYAGEHLSPAARCYLQAVWKTTSFHSAGYAAVDVGPIGWQCGHCRDGEHHLYSGDIHLEVVDEEAVVTSLLRRAMPVIRYRTGDRVAFLEGRCACGSADPRFRLLGRVDGVMNIWGCRLAFEDVERSLIEAGMTASVLQLVLSSESSAGSGYQETLTVRLEQADCEPHFFACFLANLHRYSKDIALALDLSSLGARVRLDCVAPNAIPRIARTGKVRLIVDRRDSG